ncbi:hypothetical protein SAMN00790413_04633 [Deinococcus hopiensis KR-140]|uniref:Uncharacterized protein n=2 Tax=Deinococcus TaxID=1298 RepID=A0A1W1UKI5_9DEIO|nr:hypothetical protein SAMN00790413_04633 [Deinococcus hopiensis KR-140]
MSRAGKTPGRGYTRTHLSLRPLSSNAGYDRWTVYELTHQGRVVGVRRKARFQDDFFFAPEANMITALSRTVLGVVLPANATQTSVNSAMRGSIDPAKTTYFASSLLVEAFTRGVGNTGQFNLILTNQAERTGLRAIDPPRVTFTPQQKQAVISKLTTTLAAFYRAAPDCPADVFRSKGAVAFPLGNGMSEDRVRQAVESLGFVYMLGTHWKENFPGNFLYVALHPNGRKVCVGF